MNTDNHQIKITVSEIARTLGWGYTTADMIRKRKSPADKYQKYLNCEKKLREAKEKISRELTQN
jgi:hypothetical protein